MDLISSICYDDHIRRLDKTNWQCLWCNNSCQGINANKALDHVLGKTGMHIKSCYVVKHKAHTTSYEELQHYKQTKKVVIIDYS